MNSIVNLTFLICHNNKNITAEMEAQKKFSHKCNLRFLFTKKKNEHNKTEVHKP